MLDRGAVAGIQLTAVEVDCTVRDLEPSSTLRRQRKCDRLAISENGCIDVGVLVDQYRAFAAIAR